ncbi:divergent polysaccharide deacetylase family protein [Pseudoalteromonas obscura]|uniref:Divergent polysaccharide deacetylase family protein n=1 Tax=Pseudoalteromonas obscura TaxID=3048491 RepID=A0ABT7ELI0_9GAMM|nr:divergent polysaccharide deacetylase family protein [Pseudoalteromonas sp. P94(2023)]MDK2595915.1 divergent polysaccharide deacetylase family protein [Pseudoalteromonas sp. P94(2023)]
MRLIQLVTTFICLVAFVCDAKQIAIVIDDIGNHQRDLEFLNLPGELTYALLPHTPFSQHFAYQAALKNKELILHIPMQSLDNKTLGPGGLTLDMQKWQLQKTLGHALSSLPHVKGVNNHMGSALTQHDEPMKWTMEILKKRSLYFLDSRTTPYSQAQTVANIYGVNNIARHVFLDNELESKQLELQLNQLKTIATQQGYAIGIAHPYPKTQRFLRDALRDLQDQGFELVPLSTLVENKYIRLAALQNTSALSP